ncbi:MAG: thioredoxin domain-containing protein [Bacillota bacterium]
MTTPNKEGNHLTEEKSPYLLQHVYNPVDWYPWSKEAFQKAQQEDKPIFLSIGYSTCHWCHVMERESFEDEEVAAILNQNFVAIKVDREERPDIDSIYMKVCQMLTGRGGWPLTIIMTPDQKPFFAGTYFPKESRGQQTGLIEVLKGVQEAWVTDRQSLLNRSEELITKLTQSTQNKEGSSVAKLHQLVQQAVTDFKRNCDEEYGGFGTAPKFPMAHVLMFLLRFWKSNQDEEVLELVEQTLDSMHQGGIYDHLGYGFSRYSTDRKWLVPHFEKMLYDNALLAIVYLEGYQVLGKDTYAEVAQEIFSYVERDMTAKQGGFFSAEDADSEGEEGKFYLWSPQEVKEVLGEEEGSNFCAAYNITADGNFAGKSIPNLIDTATDKLILKEEFKDERDKLFAVRDKRVHPHKDDKILTSWNGLMIAALAIGARVLQDNSLEQLATEAVEFITDNLRRDDGRLLARYRDGQADYLGYLDDYAFLIWGLIELYETTFTVDYLQLALELNEDLLDYFWDEEAGGFYFYGADSEELLTRPKEIHDGAMPSGNSVATLNLLRLARLTGDTQLEKKARSQFEYFGTQVAKNPTGYAYFLSAWIFAQNKGQEVIIAGIKEEESTQQMLEIIKQQFTPFTVVAFNNPQQRNQLTDLIPFIAEQKRANERTTAYICENFACQQPITDVAEFRSRFN